MQSIITFNFNIAKIDLFVENGEHCIEPVQFAIIVISRTTVPAICDYKFMRTVVQVITQRPFQLTSTPGITYYIHSISQTTGSRQVCLSIADT